MADTTFVSKRTVITTDWAQDVNDHVYRDTDLHPITPQRYGAAGNYTADDTTALQDFFNAVTAQGFNSNITGTVPAGRYKFTSPLTIPQAFNWSIIGESSETVELIYAGPATTVDLITVGTSGGDTINARLQGFTLSSVTVMTAGTGLLAHRLCRSNLEDVIIGGQDNDANLYHGIHFDGADQVVWNGFQIKSQADGLRVNGKVTGPKAGLYLNHYKIGGCNVGVRIGGAFGGVYFGQGDIIANGDGVVIDTTLVAEANREVFFSPLQSVDSSSRCGVVIDQAILSQLWVTFPPHVWIASSTSHGIWIKNAPGAKISCEAYIYLIGGDGVRIDDAAANVVFDNPIFNTITGYGINPTVATTLVQVLNPKFYGTASPTNETLTAMPSRITGPLKIQDSPAFATRYFTGTLNGSGVATAAHSEPALLTKALSVSAAYKTAGGAWYNGNGSGAVAEVSIDGTNVNLNFGAGGANRPYQVFILAATDAHSGW